MMQCIMHMCKSLVQVSYSVMMHVHGSAAQVRGREVERHC